MVVRVAVAPLQLPLEPLRLVHVAYSEGFMRRTPLLTTKVGHQLHRR